MSDLSHAVRRDHATWEANQAARAKRLAGTTVRRVTEHDASGIAIALYWATVERVEQLLATRPAGEIKLGSLETYDGVSFVAEALP